MSPFFSLWDMAVSLFCYVGESFAAVVFLKKFFQSSRQKKIACILLLTIFKMAWYVFFVVWGMPYLMAAVLQHLFFIVLVVLFFQGGREVKILAGAFLILAMGLCKEFLESLFSGGTLIFLHTFRGIPEPFLEEGEILVIQCMEPLICTGGIFLLSRPMESVFCGKTKRWYFLQSIPVFLLIFVVDIAEWGASRGVSVKPNGGNLYYSQLSAYGEICILTLLCAFAAGVFIFGMDELYVQQQKSAKYLAQIASYKMLEEEDRKGERLRHDMKNHVIALKNLLEKRDWEKMEQYLSAMEEQGGVRAGAVTGNRVIDALLYRKKKLAEEKDIPWRCEVNIPRETGIDEFDLCVILGNMLDNAIEGCKALPGRDAFIDVQVKTVKKCLLFEVKNTADLKEIPERGFTGKENPKGHGIGLLNIKDTTEKYDGTVQTEVENGVFSISVLLPFCRT